MSERWFWIVLGILLAFVVIVVLATGFAVGWETQIEMCWDYYSNSWQPC